MKNLMKKLKNKITNNQALIIFFIIAIIFTIYLDVLIFLIKKIFLLSSISGITTISDRVLFLTFLALVWYAWETRKMKNEMTTQTELELRPTFILFIRECKDEKQKEYCIKTGVGDVAEKMDRYGGVKDLNCAKEFDNFLIRIRNVGKGPAFNVKVEDESGVFEVEKYQSQFFAPEPKGDEQSIKIIRKDGKEIKGDYSDLNNTIFEISCENINKKKYYFKYKIVDAEKQIVEFIG